MTGDLPVRKKAIVFSRDLVAASVADEAFKATGLFDCSRVSENIDGALLRTSECAVADFLVVDVSSEDEPFVPFTALVDICAPSAHIIVIGEINDIRLYRSLRRAGAAEYFVKPVMRDLLVARIGELSKSHASTHENRSGKLILVTGVRGGVGATMIAARTAMMLSESPPRKVGLIDFDLQFGDLGITLEQAATNAVHDLLERADQLDEIVIDRIMLDLSQNLSVAITHEALGERVPLRQETIAGTLNRLVRRYRYLLAEIPRWQLQHWQEVILASSALILVSDGRISSARDIARWRGYLGKIGYRGSVIHVLSRSDAPDAVPLAEFTRLAGEAPAVLLPISREAQRLSVSAPRDHPGYGEFDRGLSPLVTHITGVRAQRRNEVTWLSRLKAFVHRTGNH